MQRIVLRVLFISIFFLSKNSFAQAPQQFNYQGALRNSDGSPAANKTVRIRLSVLEGSASGTVVYNEERSITTNLLGLYSINIGGPGSLTSSSSLGSVDWASGPKYLRVEIDQSNGANYEVAGASQLLSVPYALYAASSAAGGVNGAAGGDLSGDLPNPTVVKIQGVNISAAAPLPNQILQFDGTTWKAVDLPTGNIQAYDVATATPDVITIENGDSAALKNVSVNVKPGAQGSFLTTDVNGMVKWQLATDARLVSGTLYNIELVQTVENQTVLDSNTSGLVKMNVPGAVAGNPVFVTVVDDVLDFSVTAAWVSAANEVSIRFANYQTQPVTITGKKYRLLLIQ